MGGKISEFFYGVKILHNTKELLEKFGRNPTKEELDWNPDLKDSKVIPNESIEGVSINSPYQLEETFILIPESYCEVNCGSELLKIPDKIISDKWHIIVLGFIVKYQLKMESEIGFYHLGRYD